MLNLQKPYEVRTIPTSLYEDSFVIFGKKEFFGLFFGTEDVIFSQDLYLSICMYMLI